MIHTYFERGLECQVESLFVLALGNKHVCVIKVDVVRGKERVLMNKKANCLN